MGIGKTPTQSLDVVGNISASGNIGATGTIDCTGNLTVNTNAIYVNSSTKQVGIGKTPSQSLDVSGNISASGSIINTSDYRIKEEVTDLDETYHVDYIRPVTFLNKNTNKQDIGVIAHELKEHYPFLVEGEKDGEELQKVNYIGLIGILIKEIQELKKNIKQLQERI